MTREELAQDLTRLQAELAGKPATEVLEWAARTLADKVALACSFGAEDMVLLDMISHVRPAIRVFTLDTGRLPEETYEVAERARRRYGITLETYFPDASRVEAMVREHGPNLFYESVEQRRLCCEVRKMEPLRRAMQGLSAWICGLRREQAVTRSEIQAIEVDHGNGGLLKINPLADWTEEQVWAYIRKNDVPYNELHDRNYPSIGCRPCTRAVEPGEDLRAGRWWWESPEQKECGLHARRGHGEA